jgi:hypothetical protein
MSDSNGPDGPENIKAGETPRDSIHELLHGEENNGVTREEDSRREEAKQEAAQEAERIKSLPGDHDRGHL